MKCIYSIYIRTLGKGGEKYECLLESIRKQTIQPKCVVVVLPEGYKKPKEQLGYECYAYSNKGMVQQRLFAIEDVKTPYILLLDDDVEFEPTFIEKLFITMKQTNASCCIPILKDNSKSNSKNFIVKLKNRINNFIGSEVHKGLKDNFFMKINLFGGFDVNTHLRPHVQYYSQTGHGSNCFVESQAIKNIHFEEELWLEDCGYALPEDQVMFYKLYLNGNKIAVCRDAYFCHLDAASTNDGKRQARIAQAKAGNFMVFWYRLIYLRLSGWKRIKSIVCITHRIFWESLFYIIKYHNISTIKSVLKGLDYGFKYIKNN